MGYDIKLEDKQSKIQDTCDLEFIKLKKSIGREIFMLFKIYGKDDHTGLIDYFLPKKIYNNIFTDELKYNLAKSGNIILNDLIKTEFKKILELENENENLKRELRYYKLMNK